MKKNDKLISDYCNCINKLWEDPKSEGYKDFVDTTYLVWDYLISKTSFKDDFEFYWSPGIVISVTAKSIKTGCHFMIGLDFFKRELYFDTDIGHWENIRNLKDEFMTEFFDICTKNGFLFFHNGPYYEKDITPEFNAKYKSNIINLMHNYVSGMLLPKQERENISFGNFQAIWNQSKDMQTIINELEIAFKWFYKFNYHLWKSENIRMQNKNNRKSRIKN
ncbi:hypothetical protein CLU83_3195 [Flavobacterium sp. 1]|uniref:hypothetical protein n=1 Tax=Flavobacterium sp. 1 TaxID=2035200 RepID=UPI000C24E50A|nr:hypothetical protein [Flavobacterium sp. 1]PJJ09818.1 hypothetical protein CLU83_3195 [Flavobacterium sp. 1]